MVPWTPIRLVERGSLLFTELWKYPIVCLLRFYGGKRLNIFGGYYDSEPILRPHTVRECQADRVDKHISLSSMFTATTGD